MRLELTEDKWERFLTMALASYRRTNPGDKRPTKELLVSLMDHFVANGLVTKSGGKYVLPDIQ